MERSSRINNTRIIREAFRLTRHPKIDGVYQDTHLLESIIINEHLDFHQTFMPIFHKETVVMHVPCPGVSGFRYQDRQEIILQFDGSHGLWQAHTASFCVGPKSIGDCPMQKASLTLHMFELKANLSYNNENNWNNSNVLAVQRSMLTVLSTREWVSPRGGHSARSSIHDFKVFFLFGPDTWFLNSLAGWAMHCGTVYQSHPVLNFACVCKATFIQIMYVCIALSWFNSIVVSPGSVFRVLLTIHKIKCTIGTKFTNIEEILNYWTYLAWVNCARQCFQN